MLFQDVVDKNTAEKVFRTAVNAYTGTLTITARTIARGAPVVLATHTDSNNGLFVTNVVTSTSVVNNLYQGNVHDTKPRSVAYVDAEQQFLVQCYGIDDDAIVQTLTTTSLAGQVCIPEYVAPGFLVPTVGPTTAAATATAAHVEVPALGGLAVLIQSIASSSATSTGTAKVFLRCM